MFIRSRSPKPVAISYDSRYGQPLHGWTTLQLGGTATRVVVTGQRYGYCFSQAGGDGYAATRGCGTLVMHEKLYGARLPDGAPGTSYFYFLRRG